YQIAVSMWTQAGEASLGNSNAVVTIVDNDSPNGRLNFTATNYTVAENGGMAQVTVRRSGGNLGTLSVYYATSNGTAHAGTDYTGATNILTWNPGDVDPKTI